MSDTLARFPFEDGLSRTHHDQFSCWRWSRRALGVPGCLAGLGSGIWRRQVRAKARQSLASFTSRPQ